jgi:hypothetical protein
VSAASNIRTIIALTMEAASSSETSVNYQTTLRNNQEDSHLHAEFLFSSATSSDPCIRNHPAVFHLTILRFSKNNEFMLNCNAVIQYTSLNKAVFLATNGSEK